MPENKGTIIAGFLLIFFGILFLLDKTGALDFHFWRFLGDFWPVILIILGIWIIYEEAGHKNQRWDMSKSGRSFGSINSSPVEFGPDDLKYTASFGEVRVSLANTKLNDGINKLYASLGLGDIRIIVPQNTPCKIHGSSGVGDIEIFGEKSGGLSSEKHYIDPDYESAETKLEIRARAGVGSVRIIRT
jgi:predicted membrane protein